uniref:Uncharacterized protein n=1 Tax=Arundo donax TaxID=35708 RepID=A0A0A9DUG6_ARUDO
MLLPPPSDTESRIKIQSFCIACGEPILVIKLYVARVFTWLCCCLQVGLMTS